MAKKAKPTKRNISISGESVGVKPASIEPVRKVDTKQPTKKTSRIIDVSKPAIEPTPMPTPEKGGGGGASIEQITDVILSIISQSSRYTPIWYVNNVIQGTWDIFIDNGQIFNGGVINSSETDGDSAEWIITLDSGIYEFNLIHQSDPSSAIIDCYLDTDLIVTHDLYVSPKLNNDRLIVSGVQVLTAGDKRFRITINGRNPSSNKYFAKITDFNFIRTGDLP